MASCKVILVGKVYSYIASPTRNIIGYPIKYRNFFGIWYFTAIWQVKMYNIRTQKSSQHRKMMMDVRICLFQVTKQFTAISTAPATTYKENQAPFCYICARGLAFLARPRL